MNNADETENSVRQLIDHQAWECLYFLPVSGGQQSLSEQEYSRVHVSSSQPGKYRRQTTKTDS